MFIFIFVIGNLCTFFPLCTIKLLYHNMDYICVMHVASVWKGRKRSPKNEAAYPNIKWFCLNITCLLPEYGHLKNPGGGGGASPLVRIVNRGISRNTVRFCNPNLLGALFLLLLPVKKRCTIWMKNSDDFSL